jgi:hypothetical protein
LDSPRALIKLSARSQLAGQAHTTNFGIRQRSFFVSFYRVYTTTHDRDNYPSLQPFQYVMSDEESWNDGSKYSMKEPRGMRLICISDATDATESLISDVLQSLSDPEGSVRFTDLPCSQILRVKEDEESATKYADLCFQFLRLDEEEDLSIGARTVDHAAMCTKDRPRFVDLPCPSVEYACEGASWSENCYKVDEDGPGNNTRGNETCETDQFDAGEVDEAESVDVFGLCDVDVFDFNAFDEVPLSDADTEELRDVPPSPDLSGASVDKTGRYSTMSKGKWKEGTDGVDAPPGMSADGGGLHSTESRGKRKEEAEVEGSASEDDEPPKEPIERPIAEVFFFLFQTRAIIF